MNSLALVSIISLLGWLVLAFSSYRAHRIGAKKTVVMALAWIAIFLFVAGVFAAFSESEGNTIPPVTSDYI